jgi:hypothetical protein
VRRERKKAGLGLNIEGEFGSEQDRRVGAGWDLFAGLTTAARLRGALAFLAIVLLVTTVSACTEERPSGDGAPIEFSIGSLKFRVPRNLLLRMTSSAGGPQISVSVQIEYPTARSTTQRDEACLNGQPPCKLIEVTIYSSSMRSMDEGYENVMKLFEKQPSKGPFGYEFFSLGSEDMPFHLGPDWRGTYYRKVEVGQVFSFVCRDVPKRAIDCHTYSRTSSGAVLLYSFPRDLVEHIDRFDASLRELIDSFVIAGGAR